MEIYVKKPFWFPYFFSGFHSWYCHIHWLYPCRSFKHSNWWRHNLYHT